MVALEFRHIAVAIDGSANAGVALDTAIDLAKRYGSALSIVAVAPLTPIYVPPAEPLGAAAMATTEVPRFRQFVEAAVQRAEKAGLSAVTGVTDEGVVTDELLAFLEEHHADLLVLGSRGLSTAKRILLGSVSTAMVNHAPCPVLVVRATTTPAAR